MFRLPRPWPLLGDTQSPDELAARVAFHLHRLGLSTTSLRAAGLSRDLARSVRDGRVSIGGADAQWLYRVLAVEAGELTRPPTDEERAAWDFYRVSARHPVEVWQNAERAWRHHLSSHRIAEITGYDRRSISSVVAGRTQWPVLTLEPAERIAESLDLQDGAKFFLRRLPSHPR